MKSLDTTLISKYLGQKRYRDRLLEALDHMYQERYGFGRSLLLELEEELLHKDHTKINTPNRSGIDE